MRLISILLALMISSCAPLNVKNEPLQKPPLNIQNPGVLQLKEVKFVVVTKDNVNEVFAHIQKSGEFPVIIGLSSDGYKALGLNMAEIKQYMTIQNKIIQAYRDYYENQPK